MSKYLFLGIALAVSTSLLCMRIAAPNWFFSIFGGGPEKEVVYKTNHLHGEITVNTPIKSNGKKIQLALLLDTSLSSEPHELKALALEDDAARFWIGLIIPGWCSLAHGISGKRYASFFDALQENQIAILSQRNS